MQRGGLGGGGCDENCLLGISSFALNGKIVLTDHITTCYYIHYTYIKTVLTVGLKGRVVHIVGRVEWTFKKMRITKDCFLHECTRPNVSETVVPEACVYFTI